MEEGALVSRGSNEPSCEADWPVGEWAYFKGAVLQLCDLDPRLLCILAASSWHKALLTVSLQMDTAELWEAWKPKLGALTGPWRPDWGIWTWFCCPWRLRDFVVRGDCEVAQGKAVQGKAAWLFHRGLVHWDCSVCLLCHGLALWPSPQFPPP